MKLQSLVLGMGLAVGAVFVSEPVLAIPLSTDGTAIIAIDGDVDSNVSVVVQSNAFAPGMTYGYFLNGSSTFTPFTFLPFPLFFAAFDTFAGGDVIDLAWQSGSTYYTASGDAADASYSVEMGFANEVLVGSAQQPADWTDPYYYNVNVTWNLPSGVRVTNELALGGLTGVNDGLAPTAVSEPLSLLVLGSGLLGFGAWAGRRFRNNSV